MKYKEVESGTFASAWAWTTARSLPIGPPFATALRKLIMLLGSVSCFGVGVAAMNLELKPFVREHFAEYASWFADPDLNRQLGPMDGEWLELTVSGGEEPGDETWAVFRGGDLVAVVEALIDPRDQSYTISAVATKPALRRQGIGSAALRHVLAVHEGRGITEHTAQVSVHNQAGQRCAARAGFTPATGLPNARGYIELQRAV